MYIWFPSFCLADCFVPRLKRQPSFQVAEVRVRMVDDICERECSGITYPMHDISDEGALQRTYRLVSPDLLDPQIRHNCSTGVTGRPDAHVHVRTCACEGLVFPVCISFRLLLSLSSKAGMAHHKTRRLSRTARKETRAFKRLRLEETSLPKP